MEQLQHKLCQRNVKNPLARSAQLEMALEDAIQQQFIWAFEMLLVRRAEHHKMDKFIWLSPYIFPFFFPYSRGRGGGRDLRLCAQG